MEKFLEDRFNILRNINVITPLCFEIEDAYEILNSYDECELHAIIQFDDEIKNILEPFLSVCYTAKILYDSCDFNEIEDAVIDGKSDKFFKYLLLNNNLKLIAVYFDFIEFPSDISMYCNNIVEMAKLLKEILNDMKIWRDNATDIYMFNILDNNIEMIEEDVKINKEELSKEMKKILNSMRRKMDFGVYAELVTQYSLSLYNQDSLFDCLNYFENVYQFIQYFEPCDKLSKSISKKYERFQILSFENDILQKKLFDSQNEQSLI